MQILIIGCKFVNNIKYLKYKCVHKARTRYLIYMEYDDEWMILHILVYDRKNLKEFSPSRLKNLTCATRVFM